MKKKKKKKKKTLTRFNQVGVDGFAEPARSFIPSLGCYFDLLLLVSLPGVCLFAWSCGLLELDGWVQQEGCGWVTCLPTYLPT